MRGAALAIAICAVTSAPISEPVAARDDGVVVRGVGDRRQPPDAIDWTGRYPFDGPGGVRLYDLPWVQERAVGLLGRPLFDSAVKGWDSAVPILTEGDALLAQGCNPADCRQNVAVLIDSGMLLVCIYDGARLAWHVSRTTKPLIRTATGPRDAGCFFHSISDARASVARARL